MRRAIVSVGVGAALLIGITKAANAGDLFPYPAYDVPRLIPGISFNWTGSYIGGNIGYGWMSNDPKAFGPGVSGIGSETVSGINGGGQFGYIWQINQWVYGIETDFEASGQSATVSYTGVVQSDKSPWFGTTRARLGYAWGRLLFYATGGAGYAEVNSRLVGSVNTSLSRITVGWTAGGGVEAALSTQWSVRAEYLYIDVGDTSSVIGKVIQSSTYRDNVLRFGFNYKIAGPW
jgi:outer membrane immunogenic protein